MARVFEHPAAVKDMVIGVVACLLIFMISISFPLLGFFVILFLPFPVLFYRLKSGRSVGILILVLSMGAIFVLTRGLDTDILFCGALLLSGFFLGEFIEMHLGIEKILLLTCITTVCICLGSVAVYAMASQQGFFELISGYMQKNLELTLVFYRDMGVDSAKLEYFSQALSRVHYILVRLLPAIVAVMLTVVIWMNVLMIKIFLDKRGIVVKSLEQLNTWKAPDYLVWVAMGFGALLFLPHDGIRLFGINIALMLMLVYFFQGIGIVSFFFKKKGFPVILRILFYSIIVVQTIFLLMVIGLGFFDTWFNFRKLDTLRSSNHKMLP